MRVIVTGSRDWEGKLAEARVHQVLVGALNLSWALEEPLVVVHGDCPTGADAIADRWARRREAEGVQLQLFKANWARLGKGAGPARNLAMVDSGADLVVGFLREDTGPSPGTRNCLTLARHAGLPVRVINWADVHGNSPK